MSMTVLKTGVCAGILLAAMVVRAEDFSVGRVGITFAEKGWKEVVLPEQSQSYGGDKQGALSVQSKLYVLDGTPQEGQTLVLVTSTGSLTGGGSMTYSPKCRSDASAYWEGNEGFGLSFAQCLNVLPMYSSESVFKAFAPQVLDLQKSGMVSVLRPVYTFWSRHAVSTGSALDVRVFVVSPLAGEGVVGAETLPKGVPPSHLAWGRQLKDAVKSSVYSFSGRLTMPAFRPAASIRGGTAAGG